MQTYTVTLRYQYPAWDEKLGIPYEVEATSKADAIRQARALAYNDGHVMTGKGRITFKAIEGRA